MGYLELAIVLVGLGLLSGRYLRVHAMGLLAPLTTALVGWIEYTGGGGAWWTALRCVEAVTLVETGFFFGALLTQVRKAALADRAGARPALVMVEGSCRD